MDETSFPISEWTHNTVRDAVLELLREISQSKLSKLCQISQPLLSSIVNNKYEGKIGKRKCELFGKWYNEYRKSHPIDVSNRNEQTIDTTELTSEEKDRVLDSNFNRGKSCETRLTFHSSLEVPQLRQWFRSNPKPSDPILLKYSEHLNQSPLRQERIKVTLKSLKNWWKNERQRERNLSKKKSIKKSNLNVEANNLLGVCSSGGVDIEMSESRESSSEEEPTLTMAFNAENDSDDNIL